MAKVRQGDTMCCLAVVGLHSLQPIAVASTFWTLKPFMNQAYLMISFCQVGMEYVRFGGSSHASTFNSFLMKAKSTAPSAQQISLRVVVRATSRSVLKDTLNLLTVRAFCFGFKLNCRVLFPRSKGTELTCSCIVGTLVRRTLVTLQVGL
eukprot:827968-Amphidinium_carterae.1